MKYYFDPWNETKHDKVMIVFVFVDSIFSKHIRDNNILSLY